LTPHTERNTHLGLKDSINCFQHAFLMADEIPVSIPFTQSAQTPHPVSSWPASPSTGDVFSGFAAHPVAQFGLSQAQSFFHHMSIPSFMKEWLHSLKYYFTVNNTYVLKKLRILIFPPLHKSFSRRIVRQPDGMEVYLPPNQDHNAPDLYIPSMAFITYVLLVAFFMGTMYKFTPEVLGVTSSSGLITIALEVLLFKFGLYLLALSSLPFLEILAYCGYKFVGVTLNLLVGLIFGKVIFHIMWLVTSFSMAIFMVKTLRLAIPKPPSEHAVTKRNYFIFIVALLQFGITYFLCRSIFAVSETVRQ
jgi:hypothetical protein